LVCDLDSFWILTKYKEEPHGIFKIKDLFSITAVPNQLTICICTLSIIISSRGRSRSRSSFVLERDHSAHDYRFSRNVGTSRGE
jgi:hypothetical protein